MSEQRRELDPQLTQFAAMYPEVAAIPIGGALGGSLADKKKMPVSNTIRGTLTGLATGAGVAGGSMLGRYALPGDPGTGTLTGGAAGGLLAYLAARKRAHPEHEKKSVGPVLQQLLQMKQLSDRKDYKGKHSRLRSLIESYPDDFFIDSVNGNVAGVTHRPTNFKIHAPLRVLPVNLRGYADAETSY